MSTKLPILSVYDENGNRVEVPAIRGAKGDSYVLTESDKQQIATILKGQLNSEVWTFTLENGSTVTKTVVLK
jgi:hypothetical protein